MTNVSSLLIYDLITFLLLSLNIIYTYIWISTGRKIEKQDSFVTLNLRTWKKKQQRHFEKVSCNH